MLTIIEYEGGNMASVKNALTRLGCPFTVTDSPEAILSADKVILPGVGEAASAMDSLRRGGLDKVIPDIRAPFLGICIGLQLLCRHSEEGDTDCLGIFDTDVRKFSPSPLFKVPHMGWNTISPIGDSHPLLRGIKDGDYVYYVHSFSADTCTGTIATTTYGDRTFSAILSKGNFMGVQFHPEKSSKVGEMILENFIEMK